MKTKLLLVTLLISVFTISCGPSQEEIKRREQEVADSIKLVEKKKEEERIHFEKIEVGKSVKTNFLRDVQEQVRNQIISEEKKLASINEFQFGRLLSEKRQQIENQEEIINSLKKVDSNIDNELAQIKLFEAYDFQETPEGTVNYIFTAASKKDFSKIRNLLDPYGEFSKDVAEICFVNIATEEKKERWINNFSNGRIMGDPQISGDKAIIEIAVGSGSNRLNKIELVQRSNKWFLFSIR